MRLGTRFVVKKVASFIKHVVRSLYRFAVLFIISLRDWTVKAILSLCTPAGQCGVALVIFSAAITWFYYTLTYVKMDWIECWWFKERWRNIIIALGTAAVFYFDRGEKSSIHCNFITTFKGTILLTYIIVVLVNFGLVQDPYLFFLSLDIGVLFATVSILVLGIRHKILDA